MLRRTTILILIIFIFTTLFQSSSLGKTTINASRPKPAKRISRTVSAHVDNPTPKDIATINLIVSGPIGSEVTAVTRFKTNPTTDYGRIYSTGRVIIPIRMKNATPNRKEFIDVTVNDKGKIYKTQTFFIPR